MRCRTHARQITGDAASTAVAIAQQVGIVSTTVALDSVKPFVRAIASN
jgi:magnesium-transporting ATPase (P-type)